MVFVPPPRFTCRWCGCLVSNGGACPYSPTGEHERSERA
jgi:hypothetical protein